MKLGIVGSEAIKFTPESEIEVKTRLYDLISSPEVTEVVSGGCHLGGIDIWAIEIAQRLGKIATVFMPEQQSWEFYKKRNLQIAKSSDELHCFTVDSLPASYKGLTFRGCYHCNKLDHVKSGGCWTMKQAKKLGKIGVLHVIKNN